MSTLHYTGWLAVEATHLESMHRTTLRARLSKGKPSLTRNEVAVKIELSLPRSLFVKPALEARIKVADGDTQPPVIELEVQDTVEAILRDRTGFDVRIIQPDTKQ
jgi:hypothetical protein